MWRFVFPVLMLGALFVLVPFISKPAGPVEAEAGYRLSSPDECLDVDALRSRSKNRPLRLASEADLVFLRGANLSELVGSVLGGNERQRRLAGSLLGISGHPDGIRALIHAFEREEDPRTLAALAMALAETRRTDALEALIDAIRDRQGLAAYEACRALRKIYSLNLGLDADAWDRWLSATKATRD
jgi:HEAT repeat protein